MKIVDLLYLVFKGIKSRIVRTIYTTLGVAIGIAAILLLVSLGYGLQKILLEKITTKESLLTLDIASPESKIINLDKKIVKRISELPGVEKVSPQAVLPGQLFFGELTSEAIVNLVDSNFFLFGGVAPSVGRLLKDNETKKIVVDSQIQELFGMPGEKILGQKFKFSIFVPVESLEIKEKAKTKAKEKTKEENHEITTKIFESDAEFEVVGVVEGGGAVANIYLRESDMENLPINEYQYAKVKVREDKDLEKARDQLIGMGFMVSALSDTITQANKIFNALQIILGIFGVVGLIVAAVGLINTMSITLLERTQEIGIMRSLGASSSDIKRLFLMESTVCGFFGGVTGVLLGMGTGWLVNFGLNFLATSLGGQTMKLFFYPIWFVTFIILLSIIVGFIAGFWPARRAASLNPLEALRYK